MKKLSLVMIAFSLVLLSCGSSDEENGEKSASKCKEETKIDVKSSGSLNDFTMEKATAFLGGWQTGSSTRSKLSICYANYEMKLTSYDIDRPKEAGQYIIQLNITGEKGGKDDKLKPHKTGSFQYGSSFDEEPSAQIIVWASSGPAEGYKAISSQDLKVEITHIDSEYVCGTAQFKNDNGDTMEMSFNLPIEKDFWKDRR